MDPRFQVNDARRPVPAEVNAATPPVTLAWQALHALYQERADERERHQRQIRRVEELLVVVAEEVHRLRRLARTEANGREGPLAVAERLEQALAQMDVDIVAPEGEAYTSALMEFLDNIAQRPEPDLAGPRVAEVLTPAVLQRGAVLRMGKAVIAVPAERS